jgi:hypothetical protein
VSFLSKTELQFLQGQKQVSKSYEYKIKSILKKKLSVLLEKELPLLSYRYPKINLDMLSNNANKEVKDLTKYSKILNEKSLNNLTKISKENTKSYNIQHKQGDALSKPIKLVACEGLEGSEYTYNDYKQEKATETSNFNTEVIKQRRERDLNPRGLHRPQALWISIPGLRPSRLGDPGFFILRSFSLYLSNINLYFIISFLLIIYS